MRVFSAPQTNVLAVHVPVKLKPCLIGEGCTKDVFTFVQQKVLKSIAVINAGLVITLFQLVYYGQLVWKELQLLPQNVVRCTL